VLISYFFHPYMIVFADVEIPNLIHRLNSILIAIDAIYAFEPVNEGNQKYIPEPSGPYVVARFFSLQIFLHPLLFEGS
jgi:hypothetical protein